MLCNSHILDAKPFLPECIINICYVCELYEFIILFIMCCTLHVTLCWCQHVCLFFVFFSGSSDILFLCGRITGQYLCSHAVVSFCFVLVQVSADSVPIFRACAQCCCSPWAVGAMKIDHTFVPLCGQWCHVLLVVQHVGTYLKQGCH